MSSRGKKKQFKKDTAHSVLDNTLTPDYVSFESPFKNVPQNELRNILQEVGQKSDDDFYKSLDELKNYLKHFDVIDLTTWYTYYTLSGVVPAKFEQRDERDILQYHIEFLQALLLQNDYSDCSEIMPIIPPNLNKVEKLLLNVIESYQFRKFKDLAIYKDEIEAKKMMYIDRIRNHTMVVRNWAYPEQVIKITQEVFSKMDEDIKSVLGISIVALIEMFKKVIIKIEDKQNEHMRKVRKFYRSNDKLEIIEIYKENWPAVGTSKEDFLKISRKFSSRNDFKNSLLSHSDLFIRDIFTLDIEDYRNAYPGEIDKKILSDILDSLSHIYGELNKKNAEHFFLGNPIWCKPLVKIDNTHYVWPIPGLLFHSCFDMIELLLSNYPKLKEKYERCRAEYLEESIEREFRRGFPDAQIYRSTIWSDDIDGKNYENDLLILVDSYAIAIEAKSGKITDPAKRGAPERLKKDIEKLIVEPSIQACRFSRFLDRHSGQKISLFDKDNNDLTLDLTHIRASLTFSITLDLFGSLGTNLVELYNAGFIKDKNDLSPCMTIADLQVIIDLLDTSCEKIHYFSRRYEMEKHAKFIADELDLLVFYLETGFNIGESEYDGLELNLYGVSSKLDSYYLEEYHNPTEVRNKPQPRRTKWWNDIIIKLEERKIPRWTEFSYAFLNVSFEDQQQFESMFREVVETVESDWNKENHKNSVVLYNSFKRNDAIIVLVYKGIGRELRNTRIENIAKQAFDDEEKCKRALVLGVSLDDLIYPYNVLAVLDKKQ